MAALPQHRQVIKAIRLGLPAGPGRGPQHFNAGKIRRGAHAACLPHHIHQSRPAAARHKALRWQRKHAGSRHLASHRHADRTGLQQIQIHQRPPQDHVVTSGDLGLGLLEREPPDIHCAQTRQVDGAVAEHLHVGGVALHLEDRHRQAISRPQPIAEGLAVARRCLNGAPQRAAAAQQRGL